MAGLGAALNAIAGGGGPGAPPQAPSLGVGPPPSLPGALPPPTGLGGMPTGSAGTDAKGAASSAIMALREASGFFPSMGPAINGIIDQFKAAMQQQGPTPSVTAPDAGPGVEGSQTDPTALSGSPGEM